jgi:hypothetical protein
VAAIQSTSAGRGPLVSKSSDSTRLAGLRLLLLVLAGALTVSLAAFGREKSKRSAIVSENVVAKVARHSSPFNSFQRRWIPESVEISPDGNQVAYIEHKDGWRVVVNQNVGPRYDGITKGHFTFSEDGKRFGYTGWKGNRQANIIDRKEGKFYSKVGAPLFSRDGRHAGYMANEGTNYFWVLDDVQHALEAEPIPNGMFGPDVNAVTYVQIIDGGERVVEGGKKHKLYDLIELNTLAMTSDGKRIGYIAARGGKRLPLQELGPPLHAMYDRRQDKAKRFSVVDGREGPEYEFAHGLTFSPDGRRCCYVGFQGEEVFVITDGVEGPRHQYAYNRPTTGIRQPPLFSPDGKRVAYALGRKEHEHVVIIDGREEGPYRGIADGTLTFSPDSKRLGYIAQVGRKYVLVVDGVASESGVPQGLYLTRPVFNENGEHVVFSSTFLYINGRIEIGEGIVLGGIKFVGPAQFQSLELRKDNQIRVVERSILTD